MLPAEEYERVLNWMYDKSKERALHLKATCAPHYFRVMRQRAAAEHVPIEATHSHGKPEHGQARGNGHGHPEGPGHGGGPKMAAMTKGCLAGSAICFVSHTGEVFPCGYLPVSAGNVKRQPMQDIWEHSEVFESLARRRTTRRQVRSVRIQESVPRLPCPGVLRDTRQLHGGRATLHLRAATDEEAGDFGRSLVARQHQEDASWSTLPSSTVVKSSPPMGCDMVMATALRNPPRNAGQSSCGTSRARATCVACIVTRTATRRSIPAN